MSQAVSMKHRKIDPETKRAAALEGLRGEDRWGDFFLDRRSPVLVGKKIAVDAA
jgi:hypothetical protein